MSCEPWGYAYKCDHWCEACLPVDSDSGDAAPCWDEVDCPAHCSSCGILLNAPLTADGYEYVANQVTGPLRPGDEQQRSTLRDWWACYGSEIDDLVLARAKMAIDERLRAK